MVLLLAVHENGRVYIYVRDECVGERAGERERERRSEVKVR